MKTPHTAGPYRWEQRGDSELAQRIRELVNAARRVLSANQDAQPMEYHLAMEELRRAVEMAANGKGME